MTSVHIPAVADWEPTKFLPAAEKVCDEKCSTPPKPKLACKSDKDCSAGRPKCIVQTDGFFAECISCNKTQARPLQSSPISPPLHPLPKPPLSTVCPPPPPQFDYDCVSWDKTKFLPVAEAKCGEKCPSVVEAA